MSGLKEGAMFSDSHYLEISDRLEEAYFLSSASGRLVDGLYGDAVVAIAQLEASIPGSCYVWNHVVAHHFVAFGIARTPLWYRRSYVAELLDVMVKDEAPLVHDALAHFTAMRNQETFELYLRGNLATIDGQDALRFEDA